MVNLNLIISFITCLTLNTTTNIEKYSEALNLIINSSEYQSYNVNDDNYSVSEEVIAFAEFAINTDVEYSLEVHSLKEIVVKKEKELLKLNKRKRGNVKIFFTEEKDDLFLAEVFYTIKKRSLKYSESPSFGARYFYTFKQEKDAVKLLEVNQMHYN